MFPQKMTVINFNLKHNDHPLMTELELHLNLVYLRQGCVLAHTDLCLRSYSSNKIQFSAGHSFSKLTHMGNGIQDRSK